MSIQERLDDLKGIAGSWRALAKMIGVDHAYLYRLYTGKKTNPSDEVLRKLCLKKVVTIEYVPTKYIGELG